MNSLQFFAAFSNYFEFFFLVVVLLVFLFKFNFVQNALISRFWVQFQCTSLFNNQFLVEFFTSYRFPGVLAFWVGFCATEDSTGFPFFGGNKKLFIFLGQALVFIFFILLEGFSSLIIAGWLNILQVHYICYYF